MSRAETPLSTNSSLIPKQPTILSSRNRRLAFSLFLLALCVYTLTRLIRLPDFPIYFFTDEAIQTQHAADLIARNYRSAEGILLPTYFQNGGQYNLSLSVYAQVLPTLIFGKSVWITRGVSAMVTLIAAISLGLILRKNFNSHYEWMGPLLLAAAPAWFLHSRTAFETVMMASLYSGFLLCYLCYRQGKPGFLYPALIFGALAFYAYSPGQVVMLVTGFTLLIADARYHWQNRKTSLIGLILLVILALPYVRFLLTSNQELAHHLTMLNSYWVKPLPFYEKLLTFFSRYLKGLNPLYWFWPNPSLIEQLWPDVHLPVWLFANQIDLDRHTMRSYGHLLLVSFPFWVVGLVQCARRLKKPAYRTLLIATLAAPSGAALVDWGITRGLVFIIPTTLITALGFESVFTSLEEKWKGIRYPHIASVIFLLLSSFNFWMLYDALNNGPTWYRDYSLHGMQYGAQQVFSRATQIARADPETTVLVSSTWANGTDVLMRYFTDDLANVRMGNINAFGLEYRPLDRRMLFVMTLEDLQWVQNSDKFTNISIEEMLPYPDGTNGFYFVRLDYVKDIEVILAAERTARQTLISDEVNLNGIPVTVSYPTLDMNEISHAFDGDPTTLIRTLEANPLRLILSFPELTSVSAIRVVIGGTPTRVTATAFADQKELGTVVDQLDSAIMTRELTLRFSQTLLLDRLEITILNPHDGEVAHVHLWEVTLE